MVLYLDAAVEKAVAAGTSGAVQEGVELGSTDVKDAFFNIPVLPGDRRATCYKVFERYYASDSLVFGAGPSPLIWGRFAAWMGRAAQGLFDFKELLKELLLQIHVDDPVWIVRGTPEERRRATVALLLFWQAFGFPFSWGKGQKGPEVQ